VTIVGINEIYKRNFSGTFFEKTEANLKLKYLYFFFHFEKISKGESFKGMKVK